MAKERPRKPGDERFTGSDDDFTAWDPQTRKITHLSAKDKNEGRKLGDSIDEPPPNPIKPV